MESEVVESSTEPDYSGVDIPSKRKTEYTYVERRAELLQLVNEKGHPGCLDQTELAEQYGVCQQQISKDIKRIATHVHERLIDRDRRAFVVEQVVDRSVRGLLDQGEYRKAAKTAMEYDKWIREFHDMEQLEERIAQLEETQARQKYR
jgi:hypothetical protein